MFDRMNGSDIAKQALVDAALAAAYVGLVVLFIANAPRIFGDRPGPFGSFVFLMLFVVSAATTGGLVFGKPLMWYIDGKKREAVRLAAWTVGALAALTALSVALLVLMRR